MNAKLVVNKGEDLTGVILYIRSVESKIPFDLTSATEVQVDFPAEAGGYVSRKLTDGDIAISEAKAGKISINITDTNTSAMKEGIGQTIRGTVSFGSETRKFRIVGGLFVYV